MAALNKKIKMLGAILVLSFIFSVCWEFLPDSFAENTKISRRRKSRFSQETKKDVSAGRRKKSQVTQKTTLEILVNYVDPDSAAAQAGIKIGNIIVSMDGIKTSTLEEFLTLIKKVTAGKHTLTIKRSGYESRKSRFPVGGAPGHSNCCPGGRRPRCRGRPGSSCTGGRCR